MKPNTTRTACFLILSLSLVLVTAQGISSNYFKLWAEGSQSSNNEKPRIIEIQDDSQSGIYTSPSHIRKEPEGTNQSTNDLPDVSSQKESEGTNQTGNGVQGGVLGDETVSESTNQTDGGVTDDEESSENTNQTGETEDQTNNQEANIQNNSLVWTCTRKRKKSVEFIQTRTG